MKRIIAFIMMILMVFSVVGCGGEDQSEQESAATEESSINADDFKNQDGTVTVPDIIGMPVADAKALLKELGLTCRVVEVYWDDSFEIGSVVETDFKSGDVVDPGTQIITKVRKQGEYVDPDKDPLVEQREELSQGANSDYIPLNYEIMKAVWISQFDMDGILEDGSQKSEEYLRTTMANLFAKLAGDGFNTVIVQVRPYADSFYPSEYYPWSKYAVGGYGMYGTYDPLEIMIEEAHKVDLSFQAWINPMRAFSESDKKAFSLISENYLIRQWYEDPTKYPNYVYLYNKYFYLNIAYDDVRQLIVNGAKEIVRYYDVDGIHMDDYFYPTGIPNDFDQAVFSKSGMIDIKRFRKDNVNKLVSELYKGIKAENRNVLFGISPAGNLSNVRDNCCLDIDTILANEGFVDYIMPQIYWGFQHPTQPFVTCLANWQNLVKKDSIRFMAGLTASGVETESEAEFITNKDIFKKYLTHLQTTNKFDGLCIFSVKTLYNMESAEISSNENIQAEMENFLPLLKKVPNIKIVY